MVVPPGGAADRERRALVAAVPPVVAAVDQRLAGHRVLQADGPEFLPDLVNLAAEDGADLVCVLGHGGAEVVLDVARSFPGTRFCTTEDPASDVTVPSNVRALPVATAEVALVGGFAAGAVVGSGPPALLLPPDGDTEGPAADAFRLGFASATASDDSAAPVSVAPTDGEAREGAVARLLTSAAVVVDVSATDADPALAAVADEEDPSALVALADALGLEVGPATGASASPSPPPAAQPPPDPELDPAAAPLVAAPGAGGVPPGVLLVVTVDRVAQLATVVAELLDGWVGGRTALGFGSGVLDVAPGSVVGSTAAVAAARVAVGRLDAGEIALPTPSPSPPP
ncbi:MAG: hypothetical protein ACLGIR_13430 [Actinomycetes bacterium]